MKLLALATLAAGVFVGEAHATSFLNITNGLWSTGLGGNGAALNSGATDPHYQIIAIPSGCGLGDQTCWQAVNTLFGPSAYVVHSLNPGNNQPVFPFDGTWASGNGTKSLWIGPKADQVGPANPDPFDSNNTPLGQFPNISIYPVNGVDTGALFIYRLTFNLSALGLIPGTANVQLAWSSDDPDNGLSPNDPNYLASHINICSNVGTPQEVCATVPNSGNTGYVDTALSTVTIGSQFFSNGPMALDFYVYNKPVQFKDPSGLRVEFTVADAQGLPEPGTLALIGLGLTGIIALRRKH